MAQSYLPHATDPVLARLAQEISITQQQEIDLLQKRPTSWVNKRDDVKPPTVTSSDRVYTADQTSNTRSHSPG